MIGPGRLVSVVVPTYNRAYLLTDALESVYQQTYRPVELVVVDDGSTDDTADVVAKWSQSRRYAPDFDIRYLRQDNQGGNVARNTGVSQADGDYVAFLDSDDRWLPEKLSMQIAVFQKGQNIGGVYCGVRHVEFGSGKTTEPTVRAYPSGWLLEQLLVADVTAPTSTYVIRKEAFERVGTFDTELQARQDWDMCIRLASAYQIGCVPEALVEYRDHPGPRTITDPKKEIRAYETIMQKYAELRRHCRFSARQAAKAAFYRRMGRVYFHQNLSTVAAIGFHLRAISVWPFTLDSYAAALGMAVPRKMRRRIHRFWNSLLGATPLAIRSH